MKDALGNELIIGNRYGYASRTGAWVNTAAGILESIGESKATIAITERHTFIYGKESDKPRISERTASVKGYMLFPLKD